MNENLSASELFFKGVPQTLTLSKQPFRGFEVVSDYEDKDINLPVRGTKCSAGYDFEAAECIKIPSIIESDGKPTMVPTGIKAYMQDGEYLQIHSRSSLCKLGLYLSNAVAVIDKDYYNNENNQGHIFVPLTNLSSKSIYIKKGERIAQGIFQRYALADQDTVLNDERTGGFGSTSK